MKSKILMMWTSGGIKMNKYGISSLLGVSVLFLVSVSWAVQMSVNGTPPEYVGKCNGDAGQDRLY